MNKNISTFSLAFIALAMGSLPLTAAADSGFYIGGAVGGATIESDVSIPEIPDGLDEDDTGFKVFAGYNFDLPVVDLGIEAGYVDFGKPEINTNFGDFDLDPTGINLWGIASIEAGPIDLYAKLGYLFWDLEVSGFGFSESLDDGSDLGYGAGLAFGLGSVKIRAEYEVYDLDEADLSMLSLGIVYQFN
jgi:hypothetical protein